MAENNVKISKRVLGILLNSIGAGVVPRSGLEYIAIGRNDELSALLRDLEDISEGMCAVKFIVGRYGSGKSFLLRLIENHALSEGFVTASADLSPERRLAGTRNQGLATYRELIKNMACKASPDGGALQSILSRWLGEVGTKAVAEGIDPDSDEFPKFVRARIFEVCSELESLVNGFDFAKVIWSYYEGYSKGDETLLASSLKWLRGEYSTKLEARTELSVASVINDENWYDYVKLMALFVRKLGYKGLIIYLDECVNLYKIPNRVSRENNYEKILSMFNDTMQGKAEGLGIYFGGTPEFLEDKNRGLYSYEALRSRLSDSRFGISDNANLKNYITPVIRLSRLTGDELFALIGKLETVHNLYYKCDIKTTDEQKLEFLKVYSERMGADSLLTPREVIRDYLSVLNILMQNPEASFELLIKTDSEKSRTPDGESADEFDAAFSRFEL